jgi:hypothetical protein
MVEIYKVPAAEFFVYQKSVPGVASSSAEIESSIGFWVSK